MSQFGFDLKPYDDFFVYLQTNKPDITAFGVKMSFDEAIERARKLSEPMEPVNAKKLVPKKGLSTSQLLSRNGKKLLLKRIHGSNLQAFYDKFDNVPPPAWFVSHFDLAPVADMLLAVDLSGSSVLSAPEPPRKRVRRDFSPFVFKDRIYLRISIRKAVEVYYYSKMMVNAKKEALTGTIGVL